MIWYYWRSLSHFLSNVTCWLVFCCREYNIMASFMDDKLKDCLIDSFTSIFLFPFPFIFIFTFTFTFTFTFPFTFTFTFPLISLFTFIATFPFPSLISLEIKPIFLLKSQISQNYPQLPWVLMLSPQHPLHWADLISTFWFRANNIMMSYDYVDCWWRMFLPGLGQRCTVVTSLL